MLFSLPDFFRTRMQYGKNLPTMGFWFLNSFPRPRIVFEGPQTSSLKIHVCVGISYIGWFNDKYTLQHAFSLSNLSKKQYGQNLPTMGFCWLYSFPRPCIVLVLEGLKHNPWRYMFVWEWVILVGLLISTLCHMIFHYQARIESSMTRTFPSCVFAGWILSQCLAVFWRPETSSLKIYVCVGLCLIGIGWFNDKYSLLHDVSLPDLSRTRKQYGQNLPTMGFSCWIFSQWGLLLFWKAWNIILEDIFLCENKVYWVFQW